MFKTAKAKKRRFSAVLNVFKRFSNNSKTPPSKIEHKNEIARKTEDFLIFRAIFLTLQFSFTFPILSHSTKNITHFRHFSPLPIQFYPFPPFSTFLRFPCQLTIADNPYFHDIYYDGESHYYLDGTVHKSGVIPVLMYDTNTKRYYQMSKSAAIPILPYDEEY